MNFKKGTRFIAGFLALVMIFAMLPVTARAQENINVGCDITTEKETADIGEPVELTATLSLANVLNQMNDIKAALGAAVNIAELTNLTSQFTLNITYPIEKLSVDPSSVDLVTNGLYNYTVTPNSDGLSIACTIDPTSAANFGDLYQTLEDGNPFTLTFTGAPTEACAADETIEVGGDVTGNFAVKASLVLTTVSKYYDFVPVQDGTDSTPIEPVQIKIKSYRVNYDWDNYPTDRENNPLVTDADLPTPDAPSYVAGDQVLISGQTYSPMFGYQNGSYGTWTFDGWNIAGTPAAPGSSVTVSGDTIILGSWSFTPATSVGGSNPIPVDTDGLVQVAGSSGFDTESTDPIYVKPGDTLSYKAVLSMDKVLGLMGSLGIADAANTVAIDAMNSTFDLTFTFPEALSPGTGVGSALTFDSNGIYNMDPTWSSDGHTLTVKCTLARTFTTGGELFAALNGLPEAESLNNVISMTLDNVSVQEDVQPGTVLTVDGKVSGSIILDAHGNTNPYRANYTFEGQQTQNGRDVILENAPDAPDISVSVNVNTPPPYHVTYEWSDGFAPNGVTLPTDDTAYQSGAPVTVDPTYDSSSRVFGSNAGDYGVYKFSGWNMTDFNISDNTTISGTWTFTPATSVGGSDPIPVDTDGLVLVPESSGFDTESTVPIYVKPGDTLSYKAVLSVSKVLDLMKSLGIADAANTVAIDDMNSTFNLTFTFPQELTPAAGSTPKLYSNGIYKIDSTTWSSDGHTLTVKCTLARTFTTGGELFDALKNGLTTKEGLKNAISMTLDNVSVQEDVQPGTVLTVDGEVSGNISMNVHGNTNPYRANYTFEGQQTQDGQDVILANAPDVSVSVVTPYAVTYEWSGDIPERDNNDNKINLPTDSKDYYIEDNVVVDTTYTASSKVFGFKDGVYGVYKFSGWDTGDFEITKDTTIDDTTISGTWTFKAASNYPNANPIDVDVPIDGYVKTAATGGAFSTESNAVVDVNRGETYSYQAALGMDPVIARMENDLKVVADISNVKLSDISSTFKLSFDFSGITGAVTVDSSKIQLDNSLYNITDVAWKGSSLEVTCELAGSYTNASDLHKAITALGSSSDGLMKHAMTLTLKDGAVVSPTASGNLTVTGTVQGNVTMHVHGNTNAYNLTYNFNAVQTEEGQDFIEKGKPLGETVSVTVTVPTPYTITYTWFGDAPAGVTPPVDTNSYASNTVISPLLQPEQTTVRGEKDGKPGTWTFTGWDHSAGFTLTDNTTISGTWFFTPDVTLTFVTNGGSPINSITAAPGTLTISPSDHVSTRKDWSFAGWYADKDLTIPVDQDFILSTDTTLYAKWTANGPILIDDDGNHVAYIIGYPDGTVRPSNHITRAEVATIFFRLLSDASRAQFWSTTSTFSDVSSANWFNNAVCTLTNAKVISGYPDGTFRPNAPITRAEFATIAAKFSQAAAGTSPLTDISSHWAKDYINRAYTLGWVTGYPDNTFKPNQAITRSEAMTLVNRVLGRDQVVKMLPSMVQWSDNMDTTIWYYTAVQEATNSHTCSTAANGDETWTSMKPNPDWVQLEKAWSASNTIQVDP